MATQLYNEGEMFVLTNDMSAVTYEVGLFDDSTDALGDGATFADITTEPTGSAYSPQEQGSVTVELDGSGNASVSLDAVTFDVSDSSQSVDSVYVRDSASGDLIAANDIGAQDLSTKDGSLEISNIGFSLD